MKTVAPIPLVTPATSKSVIGALLASRIFRDYKRAFKELAGLKIELRPVESWPLPRAGSQASNALCAALGEKKCSCTCCRRAEKRIATNSPIRGPIAPCEQCRCGTVIPLWLGRQLVGIVQMVGKVRDQQPPLQTTSLAKTKDEVSAVEASPLTAKQYAAAIKLLNIFAQHLAVVSNEVVVQRQKIEPPLITRAKAYIEANSARNLSLRETARALNVSTFYFCKLFKSSTGLTFTAYLSRVRIERVKELLRNPNLRISEIAFQAGFQSLTHFNRLFLQLAGESPTEYRKRFRAL